MKNLLSSINKVLDSDLELPFSVYSSVHEQKLLNVPIVKPLLVIVLSGDKELGKKNDMICHSGEFIFLSDSPAINMRNIPKDKSYLALLIEFDYDDFAGIPITDSDVVDFFIGSTTTSLQQCLQQFVESVAWAPKTLWSARKKEILMLLYHLGHKGLMSMMGKPKLSHKIHDLFQGEEDYQITTDQLCDHLAMSDSTLRRKLKLEGTSVQEIKDRARMGLGLHLLQTTNLPISLIAEKCAYQSQSRFTQRFKGHFGLTPTELRNTKVTE